MGGFEGGDEAGFWEEKPLFSLKKHHNDAKKERMEPLICLVNGNYSIQIKSDGTLKHHTMTLEPYNCDELCVEIRPKSHILDAFDNYVELLKEEVDSSKIDAFFLKYKVLITLDSTLPVNPPAFYAAFLLLMNVAIELSLTIDELKSLAATFDLQTGFVIDSYLK